MKLIKLAWLGFFAAIGMANAGMAQTSQRVWTAAETSLQSRLRPIGTSPRDLRQTPTFRETSSRVRQAAFQGFGLPPDSNATIPGGAAPGTTPLPQQLGSAAPTFSDGSVMPQPTLPAPATTGPRPAQPPARTSLPLSQDRSLPPNPATVSPQGPAANFGPSPSGTLRGNDLQPMSQPKLLGGDYATIYNCPNVSEASPYLAGRGYGCGVSPASAATAIPYTPPPLQIAAPAVMPPAVALPSTTVPPVGSLPGGLPSATGAPAGSLVTFGQETFPVQVGQGLWGQPVAYVPGQTVRNWLRYMSF